MGGNAHTFSWFQKNVIRRAASALGLCTLRDIKSGFFLGILLFGWMTLVSESAPAAPISPSGKPYLDPAQAQPILDQINASMVLSERLLNPGERPDPSLPPATLKIIEDVQNQVRSGDCALILPDLAQGQSTDPVKRIEAKMEGTRCPLKMTLFGVITQGQNGIGSAKIEILIDYLSPAIQQATGQTKSAFGMDISIGFAPGASFGFQVATKITGQGEGLTFGTYSVVHSSEVSTVLDLSGASPSGTKVVESTMVELEAGLLELSKTDNPFVTPPAREFLVNGMLVTEQEYDILSSSLKLPLMKTSDAPKEPMSLPMQCEVQFFHSTELSVENAQIALDSGTSLTAQPLSKTRLCLDVTEEPVLFDSIQGFQVEGKATHQELRFTARESSGISQVSFFAVGQNSGLALPLGQHTLTYQCQVVSQCGP